jgi:drug/metabolite transporter (DMT)-like permease
MPTTAKVAAILLGFLGLLLLVNAVLGFTGLGSILDEFAKAARDRDVTFDRAAASSQLTTLFAAGAVLGLLAAVSCVLLAKRHKAGRLLGIACAGIQLSLAVFNAIGVGGLLNYTLLLIVLTVAILVMLFRKQTVDWLRTEPSS